VPPTDTALRTNRAPAWTDRILFTTAADSPESPNASAIKPLLYTTIPSWTNSDHKPLVALLLVPPVASGAPQRITRPTQAALQPTSYAHFVRTRWQGKAVGWIIGWIWTLLWFIGVGQPALGVANFAVGIGSFLWWKRPTDAQR